MSILSVRDDATTDSGNDRERSGDDLSSGFAALTAQRLRDPPLASRQQRGSGDANSQISFPSTPRSGVSPTPLRRISGASRNRDRLGSRLVLPPAVQRGPASKEDALLGQLKGLSNWAPVAYKATFEKGDDGSPAAIVLEDKRVLAELSSSMVEQLNCMFAFMHQVVVRERARHASNVSMMMRKVDKDLKDTYDSVKEIFNNLTQQLSGLVKEVENSREQVKAIQEKYVAARQSAEAQAQYVLELEAVLDGQCEGVAETLRKLNEQSVGKSQALNKQSEAAKEKERKMKKENERLKMELQKEKDMVANLLHGSQLLSMPEMSASWTRRGTGSSNHSEDGALSVPGGQFQTVPEEGQPGVDIVGSVLAHCDAGRAVPRAKPTRTPRRTQASPQRLAEKEVADLRKRAEEAEARSERLHHLLSFSSTSLVLLRDVVNQLRSNGYLVASESEGKLPVAEGATDPSEVLGKIARLFHEQAPRLRGLPEVLRALTHEVAVGRTKGQPPPPPPPRLGTAGPSTTTIGAEQDSLQSTAPAISVVENAD